MISGGLLMRKRAFKGFAFLTLLVIILGSCSISSSAPLGAPTHYAKIIIDTYLPNSGMSFSPKMTMALYGSTGTSAAAIDTNTGGNINSPYGLGNYARIDYTGGLDSGTYYVRVSSNAVPTAFYGAYAIRVLTSLPVPEYSAADEFATVNPGSGISNPDSYEPDGAITGGGVPTNPVAITIGDRLNRSMIKDAADDDWFVLTLP
jgi:hypothetical protein